MLCSLFNPDVWFCGFVFLVVSHIAQAGLSSLFQWAVILNNSWFEWIKHESSVVYIKMKQLIQTLYFSIIKSMIGKYVTYAMQFISVIIFSRLFTPEEFGLFSVIFSIVVFFQVIAEGGVGPAIISLTEISNKTINSIFTLICTFAVVTSLILYCCTPLLSAFFHSPRINELSFLSVVMVFFIPLQSFLCHFFSGKNVS